MLDTLFVSAMGSTLAGSTSQGARDILARGLTGPHDLYDLVSYEPVIAGNRVTELHAGQL